MANLNLKETVGRRKTAIARVFLRKGDGKITINGKKVEEYFVEKRHALISLESLKLLRLESAYNILINVSGGGISAQAEAVRLGISRALLGVKPESRETLKTQGLLTRDPREVERKKYGQPGARRKFQFSKR